MGALSTVAIRLYVCRSVRLPLAQNTVHFSATVATYRLSVNKDLYLYLLFTNKVA